MKALTFTLRTQQPLLIPSYRSGDGNSAESMAYIPGSIIRGMFVQRYERKRGSALEASEEAFRRLFLDGSVRYLNAYPIDYRGNRSLPTPLSWRISKDDKERTQFKIFDFAVERDEALEQPTFLSKAFCRIDEEDKVFFQEPARVIRYHNASQQRMVKRKEVSTVFRYEAIAPGEAFAAVVLAKGAEDLALLENLAEETSSEHIGKSRTAGYGRVEIEDIQVVPDWQEYKPLGENVESECLIFTLLSDAILRDSRTGQWTYDLGAYLGKEARDVFFATATVGGINNKWGLPLPQVPALRAGSVFVFPADAFSEGDRQRLIQYGIGERKAEGFGQVAIQWQGAESLQAISLPKDKDTRPVSLSTQSQSLARRMAERMLRAELDRRLLDALAGLKISGEISNAQLSRLRLAIRRAQQEKKWGPVQRHLADDNLRAPARQQLERARVNEQQLLTWLQGAVDEENGGGVRWTLWEQYFAKGEEVRRQVAGVMVEADNNMKLECTLRLIDALLHIASKKGGKP